MCGGFLVRRARHGALTGPMPIRDRLGRESGLRVMMRQALRLRFTQLRRARLQRLSDLAMILPAGAAQQGLISRVLDQRMLE